MTKRNDVITTLILFGYFSMFAIFFMLAYPLYLSSDVTIQFVALLNIGGAFIGLGIGLFFMGVMYADESKGE